MLYLPINTLLRQRPLYTRFARFASTMARSEETASYRFNHTMYRVKDIEKSLKFYTEVLGMEVLSKHPNDDAGFTLYYLSYDHSDGKDAQEDKVAERFQREGILELTHNHGTESDPNFKGYVSGNEEPGRGFGHIAITVDDIHKACDRFESLGVPFKKRLTDGRMKDIAFILDPDGYWIEILSSHRREPGK